MNLFAAKSIKKRTFSDEVFGVFCLVDRSFVTIDGKKVIFALWIDRLSLIGVMQIKFNHGLLSCGYG